MNAQQILMVRSSWLKLRSDQAAAADLFYARLFDLAPAVRPMFGRDEHARGAMLMAVLDAAVGRLNQLDIVRPVIERIAVQHVGYGVQPHHYDSVGAALLWTLEQALGADFTPALRQAWTAAYDALAGAMKRAAYPAEKIALAA